MSVRTMLGAAALALAALPLSGAIGQQAGGNWLATVAATDGGHRIGNPDAKVKLTEFVSYTCPHCAAFTRESEGVLKVGYIQPGNVSVEVRHLIRDPVDLTVAMLVNCGPTDKFPGNHDAFMLGQDEWIAPLAKMTAAQRQRWTTGDGASRRRAIASDFHLYEIMERRGYSRAEVDRCDGRGHRRNAAATPESTGTCSPVVWLSSGPVSAATALATCSGSTSSPSRVRPA